LIVFLYQDWNWGCLEISVSDFGCFVEAVSVAVGVVVIIGFSALKGDGVAWLLL
jgi:hypothetical protein